MFTEEVEFQWDPIKEETNYRKHKIRFSQAIQVFDDPFCITIFDRIQDGEERWHTIGSILGHIYVLVVHTSRQGDKEVIRIISARRLDKTERRRYELG